MVPSDPEPISRRQLVRAGLTLAAGLGAAYAFGCGEDADSSPRPSEQSRTPAATLPTTATIAPSPRGAAWRQISAGGTLPGPRRDHSLTAYAAGSRVYLFGGRAGGDPLGDLWVYDVEASAWSQLAPDGNAPAARFGHNAILDPTRGRFVIFGGQAGGSFFSDVWAYDPAGNSWSEIAPEGAGPTQRYGAGGAFDPAEESLIVSHGFTNQGRFDDTWQFGLGEQRWSDASPTQGERPIKRCLLRTVIDPGRGRLLLFGGQTDGTPFLGDLWAFDLADRAWSELVGEGPSPRNLYSAVARVDQPTMLLFGGSTGSGESDELWALDMASDRWSLMVVEGPPSPRSGHDAVWLADLNAMLLFGGRDDNGDLNDLWRLGL